MPSKNLKKFMDTPTKSRAQILDDHQVEVQTPDGEIITMWSDLAKYDSDEYKAYVLHLIEFIFDRNFSDDKEQMVNRISRDFLLNAVPSMGMDSGNRHAERVRIGKRIKELREAKKMEARDLALLTGIDAANLSRIEQGKYSTGVDILSRICVILDAHLDLIPNEQKEK
jgi:DNA-binding Xre family transcriptional regulator